MFIGLSFQEYGFLYDFWSFILIYPLTKKNSLWVGGRESDERCI